MVKKNFLKNVISLWSAEFAQIAGVRPAMNAQASYLEGGPLMWMLPLYLHNDELKIKQYSVKLKEYLTLSMLGKNFSRKHFEIFCLFFSGNRL